MIPHEWKIDYYITENGRCPFQDWFESLSDSKTKQVIYVKIARLRLGNYGNCSSVGGGTIELKIDYGPGFRVYFGQAAGKIILLLCGGDKSTQKKDILTAHSFWKKHKEKQR